MVILAAKSTDAHFGVAERGFSFVGAGGVGEHSSWFLELRLCGGFVFAVVKSSGIQRKSNSGVDHFCVWFPLFKGPVFLRARPAS